MSNPANTYQHYSARELITSRVQHELLEDNPLKTIANARFSSLLEILDFNAGLNLTLSQCDQNKKCYFCLLPQTIGMLNKLDSSGITFSDKFNFRRSHG
jgi:hypothetical protein